MKNNHKRGYIFAVALLVDLFAIKGHGATTSDKLYGVHSARNISTSYPWIAQEAGLFKKYNLDFHLVFIAASNIVTAALLSGDAEMTVTGGIGNVAAFVRGSTDVVFIGGVKNVLTQTLVASGI
jgi:ABC-type nitrate/sulfonate/bicarbonate transport system substrate-binding protein